MAATDDGRGVSNGGLAATRPTSPTAPQPCEYPSRRSFPALMKLPVAVLLSFVMFAPLGESQVRSRNAEVAVSNGTARFTFADYPGIPRDLKFSSGAATVERADIFESPDSVVTSVPEGPWSRAEELIAALIRGDWTAAARFVYLDANTRARMGIASGAGMAEAQPRVEAWFKNLYEVVRPGRVVSVNIDAAKPTHALVSYTHEDLDGFSMLYVNGDWYYVLD